MGYTTRFSGAFKFNRPLSPAEDSELREFAEEDHRKEDCLGHGSGSAYCQWVPTSDGTGLEWDGNEKFYYYEEWLAYLIKRFFEPWGIVLNGTLTWQGEEVGDVGELTVKDNVVSSRKLS